MTTMIVIRINYNNNKIPIICLRRILTSCYPRRRLLKHLLRLAMFNIMKVVMVQERKLPDKNKMSLIIIVVEEVLLHSIHRGMGICFSNNNNNNKNRIQIQNKDKQICCEGFFFFSFFFCSEGGGVGKG